MGIKLSGSNKTVSFVILGIGILLVIIALILFGVSMAMGNVTEDIADGSDLTRSQDGSYRYKVDSTDATSKLLISIESKSGTPIEVVIKVEDTIGISIFSRTMTTPVDLEINTEDETSSYLEVTISFTDDTKTVNDVNVNIAGEKTSGSAACLCCTSGILPIIGLIMIIIGIILIVKKKKPEQVANVPSYQSNLQQQTAQPQTPSYTQQQPAYPQQQQYQTQSQPTQTYQQPAARSAPVAQSSGQVQGALKHSEEAIPQTNYNGPSVLRKVPLDHERTNLKT